MLYKLEGFAELPGKPSLSCRVMPTGIVPSISDPDTRNLAPRAKQFGTSGHFSTNPFASVILLMQLGPFRGRDVAAFGLPLQLPVNLEARRRRGWVGQS